MPRSDSVASLAPWLLVSLGWCVLSASEAGAQGGNAVDGAVWRFGLERIGRGPGPGKLRGACRILNYEMFQRETDSLEPIKDDDPQAWTKKIGVVARVDKKPPASKVTWTITDMQVFDERRKSHQLNGTIKAECDEAGHWSGQLIDGDGRRWNFKVQRIRE